MMKNSFKETIHKKKLPITLLFMENVTTENTIPHITITINYNRGKKMIAHDFYKHISTY